MKVRERNREWNEREDDEKGRRRRKTKLVTGCQKRTTPKFTNFKTAVDVAKNGAI